METLAGVTLESVVIATRTARAVRARIAAGKANASDFPLLLHVDEIISKSGDSLRLSFPDKKLISLAYMMYKEGNNVKVITDDYSIQNTLKIIDIPYSGIITDGIKGIYNWKKVCEGCKKEYGDDYPFDDCEICGSKIFKKRIKVNK